MKFIKNLFLIPIVILLFSSLLLLQINFGMRNTLFSEEYFSNHVEEGSLGEQVTSFIVQKVDNIKFEDIAADENFTSEQIKNAEKMLQGYKDMINENLDKKWLGEQINLLVKGVHGYMVNESGKLPVLDISPIKEVLPNMYASQISTHSDNYISIDKIEGIVNKVKKQLKSISKVEVSRERMIQEVMKLEEIKSLNVDEGFAEKIIDNALLMDNDKESIEKIYGVMVKEMIKDKLNIDKINDKLDLNAVINKIYEHSANPIIELKNIKGWYTERFFTTNLLIVGLLIVIMLSLSSNIINGVLLLALTFISSGSAVGLMIYLSKNKFISFILREKNPEFIFFKDFINNFTLDLFNKFFIQAAVIIGFGLLLIAVSYVINKKVNGEEKEDKINEGDNNENKKSKGSGLIIGVRILLIISSIVFIWVSVKNTTNDLIERVDSYKRVVKVSSENVNKEKVIDSIFGTMNAEFLKEFINGGKE